MKKPPKNVEDYIAAAPEEVRPKLRQIRAAIRGVSPDATESISYGMPLFSYRGRLAWFSCLKKDIGLYLRPPVIEEHRNELGNYGTTKSAVRFPLDQDLPIPLIKRLVRDRMKKNEVEPDDKSSYR